MKWFMIFGFIAATCTTISFIPQVVKTIRTKHTKDISLGMYSLLTFGIFLWCVYGIIIKDPPVIIANAIGCVASAIIFIHKIVYK